VPVELQDHESLPAECLTVFQKEKIMGLFTSTEFNSLDCLLHDQLADLYDAEQRLTEALPKMADAADAPELKQAFEQHLRETHNQVNRLERVFEILGKEPKSKTCAAMKGLIAEGEEVISASGDPEVKDAALIAAAQRVEHYEMAGYGSARTFAHYLHQDEVARLLQETLDEEGATDHKLTDLAEQFINAKAARA
jgi:ferritin-like metal-binding protein YciE